MLEHFHKPQFKSKGDKYTCVLYSHCDIQNSTFCFNHTFAWLKTSDGPEFLSVVKPLTDEQELSEPEVTTYFSL